MQEIIHQITGSLKQLFSQPLVLLLVLVSLAIVCLASTPIAKYLKTKRILVGIALLNLAVALISVLVVGRFAGLGSFSLSQRGFHVTRILECNLRQIGDYNSTDVALNVLMLIPLTIAATLIFRRPLMVIAGVTGVAVILEGLQASLDLGVCQSTDIIANVCGSIIAALTTSLILAIHRFNQKTR